MILSRASEYGILALLLLNQRGGGEFVTIKDIARRAGISVSFLAKVLGRLVGHGILQSLKGPSGGVRLAHAPADITLLQVVEAIDGLEIFRSCVIGYPECGPRRPCPVHDRWGPLREGIVRMLSEKSLADFGGEVDGAPRGRRKANMSGAARPARSRSRRKSAR